MEGILTIFLVIAAIALFNVGVNFVLNLLRAGARTVSGRGSFAENLKDTYTEMGSLEIRAVLNNDPNNELPDFYQVEARGLFPLKRPMDVAIAISVLDVTEGYPKQPVLSSIDDFCEPYSRAFQLVNNVGRVQPNHGFVRWAKVGVVIPSLLIPPQGGDRKLRIIMRAFNAADPIAPELGFDADGDTGELLAIRFHDVEHHFGHKGYVENAESRRRMVPLSIKLAVAVAFADGEFHDQEGELIRSWIERHLSIVSESRREAARQDCNQALREAYSEGRAGELSLSALCEEIRDISDVSQRYEAIELCLDMMAADGRAEVAELETIRRIADVFELDVDELQRLKDQRLVTLDVSTDFEASLDGLNEALGINPDWPPEKIRKHLRGEFKKWNSRINNLSEESERANAQARLDMISKARELYG